MRSLRDAARRRRARARTGSSTRRPPSAAPICPSLRTSWSVGFSPIAIPGRPPVGRRSRRGSPKASALLRSGCIERRSTRCSTARARDPSVKPSRCAARTTSKRVVAAAFGDIANRRAQPGFANTVGARQGGRSGSACTIRWGWQRTRSGRTVSWSSASTRRRCRPWLRRTLSRSLQLATMASARPTSMAR